MWHATGYFSAYFVVKTTEERERERARYILQRRKKHRLRGEWGEEVGFVLAKRCIVYRNCFYDF